MKPNNKPRSNGRSKLSEDNFRILEKIYEQEQNPSSDIKKQLARDFSVSLRIIQNWFQSRRLKEKEISAVEEEPSECFSPIMKGQAFKLDSKNKMVAGKNLFFFNPDALYKVKKAPSKPKAPLNYFFAEGTNESQQAPPSPIMTPVINGIPMNMRQSMQHRHTVSGNRPDLSGLSNVQQEQQIQVEQLYKNTIMFNENSNSQKSTDRRHSISFTPSKSEEICLDEQELMDYTSPFFFYNTFTKDDLEQHYSDYNSSVAFESQTQTGPASELDCIIEDQFISSSSSSSTKQQGIKNNINNSILNSKSINSGIDSIQNMDIFQVEDWLALSPQVLCKSSKPS